MGHVYSRVMHIHAVCWVACCIFPKEMGGGVEAMPKKTSEFEEMCACVKVELYVTHLAVAAYVTVSHGGTAPTLV